MSGKSEVKASLFGIEFYGKDMEEIYLKAEEYFSRDVAIKPFQNFGDDTREVADMFI